MSLSFLSLLVDFEEEENGEELTDRKEIGTVLNSQFKSVFTVDDSNSMPVFTKRTNEMCKGDVEVTFGIEGLEKRLGRLNEAKAKGRDKVSAMVLKSCAGEWAMVLLKIFQKSFDEGIVPEEWGMANIITLFKNGSKLDAVNYRPVSLTSVCCKLMEGIVRDELMEYFYKNKLISSHQNVFVRRKACVTNLLECQKMAF